MSWLKFDLTLRMIKFSVPFLLLFTIIKLLPSLLKETDLFTLLVMIEMLSSRLKSIKGAHYGLARRRVKPSFFFWTIFISDLAPSYKD